MPLQIGSLSTHNLRHGSHEPYRFGVYRRAAIDTKTSYVLF